MDFDNEDNSSDYVSEDDYDYDFKDDDVNDGAESDEDSDPFSSRNNPKQNFRVLNGEEVLRNIEQDINELCSIISVSADEASILLRHYGWSVNNVTEAWFGDEQKVREKAGSLEEPVVVEKVENLTCGICFESYSWDEFKWGSCGHSYCSNCWLGYITTSINNDGPRCLYLRCPEPKCRVSVTRDVIDSIVSRVDRRKYDEQLVNSYVESNTRTKNCPGPGCEFIVECVREGDESKSFDVTCGCNHRFCFKCVREFHRPVDCETVQKWLKKNCNDGENAQYMLAYTKPCPNCKRAIEKNEGCDHMQCKICNYEFCWMCFDPWKSTDENRHICRDYRLMAQEEEERRSRSKEYIDRYNDHFKHWAANLKKSNDALEDLERFKNWQLEKLSHVQVVTETSLNFIIEAWQLIAECRLWLRWTYVYGYYMAEEEAAKKNFFEYLHKEAEAALEKLHYCTKIDLQEFKEDESPLKGFNDYRIKLVELTSVTRNYFKKLMKGIENNLYECHQPY